MQITTENLVEEYHLPADPVKLKKRLADIVKTYRRLHGKPAANSVLEEKIKFIEEWMEGIAAPVPRPLPPRIVTPKKIPNFIPVNKPKK